MRALKLEAEGYKVSVVEYISPLDTPKNLLIRATRTGKVNHRAKAEYDAVRRTRFGTTSELDRRCAELDNEFFITDEDLIGLIPLSDAFHVQVPDDLPDTLLLFEQKSALQFLYALTEVMPVKLPDKGLLLSSRVDFTIPSPFARKPLYYLIQYRRYPCVPGYEVKQDFLDMYLYAYVRSHTAGGVWMDV